MKQISFVPLAVSAIFALAEAARAAHATSCSAVSGVCPDLLTAVRNGVILQRLHDIQVNTRTAGNRMRCKLAHDCVVYTEHAPRRKQFRVGPVMSQLNGAVTTTVDIQNALCKARELHKTFNVFYNITSIIQLNIELKPFLKG